MAGFWRPEEGVPNIEMAKLARLGALLELGESSPVLPACEWFPNGFVNASGPTAPGPNNWRSAGAGNVGGGVGENDDVAGVIMVEFAAELGICEPGRNEVSSGVMAKSLGILAVELLALRRLAGPEANEGEAGRERCWAARDGWSCSGGIVEMGVELDELRLAACRSKLGDDSKDGPGALWTGTSSRELSITFGTPGAGLGAGLGLVVL
jgi:hypothetical protein